MKIKETIERECCDPDKDLRPVGEGVSTIAEQSRNFDYRLEVFFCIHCGQWWVRPYSNVTPSHYKYTKLPMLGGEK